MYDPAVTSCCRCSMRWSDHESCLWDFSVKTLLLLAGLTSLHAVAEDRRVTALVMQGDLKERQHHTRAALTAFRAAEQIEPKNVGVLLRMAKQYSDLVDETRPANAARLLAEQARDYALRAVQLAPNNAKARLTLAVCYGKLTDYVGNKTKLEYSKLIRDETLASIALDPRDDFAWHVLGRWHFGVANVNGVLKALANLVYDGMPDASNEEAVKALKKACDIAPQRIIHHSELARVYKTMGKHDLAEKEWQLVRSLPATDKGDEKDQREAQTAVAPRSQRHPDAS